MGEPPKGDRKLWQKAEQQASEEQKIISEQIAIDAKNNDTSTTYERKVSLEEFLNEEVIEESETRRNKLANFVVDEELLGNRLIKNIQYIPYTSIEEVFHMKTGVGESWANYFTKLCDEKSQFIKFGQCKRYSRYVIENGKKILRYRGRAITMRWKTLESKVEWERLYLKK